MRKRTLMVENLPGAEAYKLCTGLVVPRPIGWIGTRSVSGTANLAPYSFFNVMSGVPPIFVFSPGRSSRRDTLANVRAVPEFTINIVTEEVAEAMNASSASVDADVDEFQLVGLTSVEGAVVRAPMVGECKANIECRVIDIVDIGDPAFGNSLVIGEGVAFHVREDLLDGTRIDQVGLAAIGRHAGNGYSTTRDQFILIRPD